MEICEKGFEQLRFAIIKQAAEDYLEVLTYAHRAKKWERTDKRVKMERMKNDCEAFFHSQWYEALCDIPCNALMEELRRRSYSGEGLVKF